MNNLNEKTWWDDIRHKNTFDVTFMVEFDYESRILALLLCAEMLKR